MHLCTQDDHNGLKILALPSAAMARLTHFIMPNKIFLCSEQASLADNYELAMFYKVFSSIIFIKTLLLELRFLCFPSPQLCSSRCTGKMSQKVCYYET
jgi:hypothetical protein